MLLQMRGCLEGSPLGSGALAVGADLRAQGFGWARPIYISGGECRGARQTTKLKTKNNFSLRQTSLSKHSKHERARQDKQAIKQRLREIGENRRRRESKRERR